MTDICNTTSRSELVDRCVRIEIIAVNALTTESYSGHLGAQDMARDIIAALRGSVTVTNTATGLPPP